jgi:hypothetical protein
MHQRLLLLDSLDTRRLDEVPTGVVECNIRKTELHCPPGRMNARNA